MLIEPQRFVLVHARLDPQQGGTLGARFQFDLGEHGRGYAASSQRQLRIHALDLGIAIEKGDAAAANCYAIRASDKKANAWHEQLVDGQGMTLIGSVRSCKRRIQFGQQLRDFSGGRMHLLDCDSHHLPT